MYETTPGIFEEGLHLVVRCALTQAHVDSTQSAVGWTMRLGSDQDQTHAEKTECTTKR